MEHWPTPRSRWVCGAADREHRREADCGTGEQGTRLQPGRAVFAVGAGLLPCCEQVSCGAVNFETCTRHPGTPLAAGLWEGLQGRPRLLVVGEVHRAEKGRADLAAPGVGLSPSILDPTADLPSSTHPTKLFGTPSACTAYLEKMLSLFTPGVSGSTSCLGHWGDFNVLLEGTWEKMPCYSSVRNCSAQPLGHGPLGCCGSREAHREVPSPVLRA